MTLFEFLQRASLTYHAENGFMPSRLVVEEWRAHYRVMEEVSRA